MRAVIFLALVLAAPATAQSPSDDDFCRESLAAYESTEEAGPTTTYNAACCMSLAGRTDDAFATLSLAVERGFRDPDHLASDPDLFALHDDPRWPDALAACRAALAAYLDSINLEMYEMFQADQSDRSGEIDWSVVVPRDEARRQRALELVQEGALHAPDDFVHAAFIFQHGGDSTSYGMAHDLALKAVEMDAEHMLARWIAAASRDRYLQSVGKPQIYGTQYRKVDGVWTLEPIDPDAVTDEERARWGVPPLERARKRVKEMNAGG